MLNRALRWAAMLTLGITCAQAHEVQSLQPLLLEALATGRAEGRVVGPIAETFARLFLTTEPLRFSVRRVAMLSAHCGRLEVTASQGRVLDRNATQVASGPESRRLTYQVSMCADGNPPTGRPGP